MPGRYLGFELCPRRSCLTTILTSPHRHRAHPASSHHPPAARPLHATTTNPASTPLAADPRHRHHQPTPPLGTLRLGPTIRIRLTRRCLHQRNSPTRYPHRLPHAPHQTHPHRHRRCHHWFPRSVHRPRHFNPRHSRQSMVPPRLHHRRSVLRSVILTDCKNCPTNPSVKSDTRTLANILLQPARGADRTVCRPAPHTNDMAHRTSRRAATPGNRQRRSKRRQLLGSPNSWPTLGVHVVLPHSTSRRTHRCHRQWRPDEPAHLARMRHRHRRHGSSIPWRSPKTLNRNHRITSPCISVNLTSHRNKDSAHFDAIRCHKHSCEMPTVTSAHLQQDVESV